MEYTGNIGNLQPKQPKTEMLEEKALVSIYRFRELLEVQAMDELAPCVSWGITTLSGEA